MKARCKIMSIRPVDLQVMVPRITETAKAQHNCRVVVEGCQDTLTDQFRKQLQTARQKVNERDKSQKIKLQSENNPTAGKNNKRRNKKTKKGSKAKREGHIDLII
jgi:hypothetical protein